MRKTLAVLLAALTVSCGGADDMTTWDELKERNAHPGDEQGQWQRVGKDWVSKEATGEKGDEIRWGDTQQFTVNVNALGTFASPTVQQVQAVRPAQAWSINVALTLPGGRNQIPTLGNDVVVASWMIELGVGSSRIIQYIRIDSSVDTFVDLFGRPPSINRVITSIPAKQIVISSAVEWRTLGAPAPGLRSMALTAQVAPLVR
jgi:hypothetical protein